MDHIEKMAAECMKDLNEDDDEGLEEDTELLAELQEVLGEEDGGVSSEHETETMEVSPAAKDEDADLQTQMTPAVSSELEQTIEERIANYKVAILNAKEAGESAKVRRYERGLKALHAMLTAVKKGKKVNTEEMPPPVASGKSSLALQETVNHNDLPKSFGNEDEATGCEQENKEGSAADHELKDSSNLENSESAPSLQGQDVDMAVLEIDTISENNSPNLGTRALLVTREKEYKLAALKAKQRGDLEKAKEYMRTGKKFSMVLEALDSGQPVDLKDMPPALQEPESLENMQPPSMQTPSVPVETSQPVISSDTPSNDASGSLQQPNTVLEALQQRLEKYKAAAAQAKANGDSRKSRMHERIAKQNTITDRLMAQQYQDAIRAHKAGKKVNFAELPVPPGFPPIPGMVPTEDGSTFAAVLENASRLVKLEEEEQDKDEDDNELPSPPTDDEGDFIFIHHDDVRLSQKTEEVYSQLIKLLRDQHEKCVQYSKQFMHLGNVAETTRFEKLAQNCKRDLDILQLAQAQGLDPPSHHFEERTFKIVRIFSELSSTEMHLIIVRGINLPAPPAEKSQVIVDSESKGEIREIDTEIPILTSHQASIVETENARDRALEYLKHWDQGTLEIEADAAQEEQEDLHQYYPNLVYNEDSDRYLMPVDPNLLCHQMIMRTSSSHQMIGQESCFCRNIHIVVKVHESILPSVFTVMVFLSFFRSDKQVGTAHLKLDKLESECEIREIIEVLDSRKPTGGKLEVKVRLREPLSGQDLQTITENWLVLEH
ncbi:hypothetical protein JD844_017992 [Phrynosoma platyrhinos]|uniref:DM14 domain-containing protein n=1 Tax=Phrynosoma platyrhinos TaxID=52577 RepID=A0ABQ7SMS8_PHRPL|nr:hypothetical protein JD844_017992 [Phrynosoma platyrhinos]